MDPLSDVQKGSCNWLRTSQYQRHGLPAADSIFAKLICEAINKCLFQAKTFNDLHDNIREASCVTVNSKALKKAYHDYARLDMLPPRSRKFFDARRTLSSRFEKFEGMPSNKTGARDKDAHIGREPEHDGSIQGEARVYIANLQKLCSRGMLRPRDGLELTYQSSPPLPVLVNTTATITITLANNGQKTFKIMQWDLLRRPKSETILSDDHDLRFAERGVMLRKGESIKFTVQYIPRSEGCAPSLFVVDAGGNNRCAIVIPLEATSEFTRSQPKGRPYIPRTAVVFHGNIATVGEKPKGTVVRYRSPVSKRQPETTESAILSIGGKGELNPDNYARVLHAAWDLEQHTIISDLRLYSLSKVPLRFSVKQNPNSFITVVVPGLAESRPSVLRGDRFRVRDHLGQLHDGFVHAIMKSEVWLKFSHAMQKTHIDGQLYDVEFCLNDSQIRKRHVAIDSTFKGALMHQLMPINPNFDKLLKPFPVMSLPWNNKGLNEQQRLAVSTIMQRRAGQPPFIIFGPPGTGKSSTVVEAVYQVFTQNPFARILVCAPSNAATDLLLVRFVQAIGATRANVILRANAAFRTFDPDSDAPEVLKYSHRNSENDCFQLPESVSKYRVVFSTLAFAQVVIDVVDGFDKADYVFIDEAGHADEPEVLMCLGTLAQYQSKSAFRLILAGDPFQLGPIVHNKQAAPVLRISLLERLMRQAPYCSSAPPVFGDINFDADVDDAHAPYFNSAYVVKLCNNYRSHFELLKVPSTLFYDGELHPCVSEDIANRMLGWEKLPNPRIPLIVHGIRGKHEQEDGSPSFFNMAEVSQVRDYMRSLREARGRSITAKDIGIVTPYTRQCQKMNLMLSSVNCEASKVGTVEIFQGDERPVIILSTVRSDVDAESDDLDSLSIGKFLQFDQKHNLGFLSNAKRFNVAVTRAQSLLIVVCNPFVVSTDQHWKSLLKFAISHDCYTGIPFDLGSGDSAEKLVETFRTLSLHTVEADLDEDEVNIADDTPHRREL